MIEKIIVNSFRRPYAEKDPLFNKDRIPYFPCVRIDHYRIFIFFLFYD